MYQGVQFKQVKPWRYLFVSFHFEEWLQGFALKGLVSVKKPYFSQLLLNFPETTPRMAEYCWNLRPLLMVETTHFNERMIFFPCSFSAEKSTAEREEYKSVEKTGATTV